MGGPGRGEGILIVVGKHLVIGVDCCPTLTEKGFSTSSYLHQLFSNLEPDFSIYWLLTHYHLDHFTTLATTLDEWQPRIAEVIVPSDYTPADISYDVKLSQKVLLERDEYDRLQNQILKPGFRSKCKSIVGHQRWIETVLVSGEQQRNLSVEVFGPDILTHKNLVGKAVRTITSAKGYSRSRRLCNLGSYLLLLKVDRFVAIFLADCPSLRTVQYDWETQEDWPGVAFLKVAHHGSKDGTSKQLLAKLNPPPGHEAVPFNRIAGIAPFDQHGLPKGPVVRAIENAGFQVRSSKTSIGPNPDTIKKIVDSGLMAGVGITPGRVTVPKDHVLLVTYPI